MVEILSDNLQNFQSPNVIWLRCQIVIRSGNIDFHPIPSHIGKKGPGASFAIDLPSGMSNGPWAVINGSGAPFDRVVLVFTWLIDGQCWVQEQEVEPAQDGRWVHPQCNLNSPRDRFVAALAVNPAAVPQVRAMFKDKLTSIRAVERALTARGVNYPLAPPQRLQLVR
jgi:hypothetical protein